MELLNKTGLIRIVLIATVLFSLFFLIPTVFRNIDLQSLLRSETRHFLAVAVFFVFVHFCLEPLRWYLYSQATLRESSSVRLAFTTVFAVLSTTALLGYTMPFKLGLPTRIYLMKVYFGMRVKQIVYFLAVDGFTNLAIWGLFGAITLAYLVPFTFVENHFGAILVAAATVFVAGYFGRSFLRKAIKPLLDRHFTLSARTIVLAASLVTIDVIVFGFRHIAIFMFLGLPIDYPDAFLIGILSVFAGIASTLPMGLGAYDGTVIFLLTRYGIPLELASLAPILNRTLNLLTSMLFGSVSSIFLMKSARAIPGDDEQCATQQAQD